MMERLSIKKLGPIEECEIEINEFMILTGPQASGKSTVSKCVFFFENLKGLLTGLIQKSLIATDQSTMEITLYNRFIREIRNNFLQIFGTTWAMDPDMTISYVYGNEEVVSISLTQRDEINNFAYIEISRGLRDGIFALEKKYLKSTDVVLSLNEIKKDVYRNLFCNEREIVYIPAGRSLITLLSSQINYLYSTMDDQQKRSLDYCTQNYLERILQIKPFFRESLSQLILNELMTTDRRFDQSVLRLAADISRKILKGEYRSIDGEERLQISAEKYIKINYSSSGQQEAVWILNVLFYYMLNGKKVQFIIEEPESHLYPDAQKLMTDYIALVAASGNRILMTTHSPYVLGSVNNLLYARHISTKVDTKKLEGLCDPHLWLDFHSMQAFHVQNGILRDCTDSVFENIENDVIDGASDDINNQFEKMVDLVHENELEDHE